MARVCERTWASLRSWSLCGITLVPLCTNGPVAGVHGRLIEFFFPVCARTWASWKLWPLCVMHCILFVLMAPVRDRIGAALKSWLGAH